MHKSKKDKSSGCGCEKKKESDCGCKPQKKECHRQLPTDSGCGDEKCGRNCCTKIAWIDYEDTVLPNGAVLESALRKTEPYLNQLTRFYPSSDWEVYYSEAVLAPFPYEALEDETPEELLARQEEWLATYGKAVANVAELIENLVCRGFRYIGLPSDFSIEYLLRGGTSVSRHGKGSNLLYCGKNAAQAFPGVKFMIVSYTADFDPTLYPNLWVFSDFIGQRSNVQSSLEIIIGETPLTDVVIKSVYTTRDGVTPTPGVAPYVDQLNAATAPGGPLFGVTVELIPLTIPVGGDFNPAEIQAAAALIRDNNVAAGDTGKVIVSLGVSGTLRDTFATAVNAYDATSDPTPGSPNPPFFSPAYTAVTYFGNPFSPNLVGVGADVVLGLSPANGSPSPVQVALGLPCDFADYWFDVNVTFVPSYFLAYVWAANCEKVPADVTGIPLRFHKGTHEVVSQWLWYIVSVANQGFLGQSVPDLTQNPEWCDGGAFGW